LTSIEIPNSVTEIGEYAFYDCKGLTSVEIPDSVTEIGKGAFSRSGLTSIEIPNSVTEIGEHAFSGCERLTSIEIPNSVTEIGECAFSWCKGLTSIEIPNSVTKIGARAFSWCTGLTSIIVDERNKHYSAGDGILYSKDKTLLQTCLPSKIGVVKVPDSVTEIGAYAFDDCTGLTSIVIPDSVTEIGDHAFGGCKGLREIHCRVEHLIAVKFSYSAFWGIDKSQITVYVPIGTGYEYRHHPDFLDFKEIVVEK
ncbi:MAG: leucine-rich repeat domain-containing protein, partial [Bacteroidales bacterium]|nr:leucine-rich repeat domain-containing protein [Bacteroidales bacterium]